MNDTQTTQGATGTAINGVGGTAGIRNHGLADIAAGLTEAELRQARDAIRNATEDMLRIPAVEPFVTFGPMPTTGPQMQHVVGGDYAAAIGHPRGLGQLGADLGQIDEIEVHIHNIESLLSGVNQADFYKYYLVLTDPQSILKLKTDRLLGGEKVRIISIDRTDNIFNTTVGYRHTRGTSRCNIDGIGIRPPDNFDPTSLRKKLAIELLTEKVNRCLSRKIILLTNEAKSLVEKIDTLSGCVERDQIKTWITATKEITKMIADAKKKVKKFDEKEILKTLFDLKKHPQVEKLYINRNGVLYVKTKSLNAMEWDKVKPRRAKIGSMLIGITYGEEGANGIYADNFDYRTYGHCHPQVQDNRICMGADKKIIETLKNSGEIYSLVDFLIIFLSTIFQEDSTYYVDSDEWLSEKEKGIYPTGEYMGFREEKWEV